MFDGEKTIRYIIIESKHGIIKLINFELRIFKKVSNFG